MTAISFLTVKSQDGTLISAVIEIGASQWNNSSRRVRKGWVCVGHVDFMLFVSCSLASVAVFSGIWTYRFLFHNYFRLHTRLWYPKSSIF